jgi:hypothetical protein
MGVSKMNIKTLSDIPPWEWPTNADKMIFEVLCDGTASDSERLLAAEMAGDATVVNDVLADALLSIVCNDSEPDDLRSQAAISLGPALEYAFIEDFDDPEDVPITEAMFSRIQEAFHKVFMENSTPKIVRRRTLEASVRAPLKWHQDAVRDAYTGDDEDWKLTAVFCMQYIRGFHQQILESLSNENMDIVYEAVCGAGNWEIDAAWPYISGFVTSEDTDRDLLLAAIEAAALIRPHEASGILGPLLDSDDEDISDAVYEALAMTGMLWDDDDEDEDAPTIH